MIDTGQTREETLMKLAHSRAEIRRLLEPPPRTPPNEAGTSASSGDPRDRDFPRSRTMRALMSGRGVGTVGAVVGGLLLARPGLAFRLLRMLPTGAVARMVLVKAMAALRSKSQ